MWSHPLDHTSLEVLSFGGLGWVYKVDDLTAVKVPKTGPDRDKEGNYERELASYTLIESHGTHPNIVQTFLRLPQCIFMPYYKGRTLDQRVMQHQDRRDTAYGRGAQVVEVKSLEPVALVERWTAELASAVAWLEGLGYVHGDLAPRNCLLDENEHVKLIDFEYADKIGARCNGNECPYSRILGEEGGDRKGSFGDYGARTEQFSIGSIIYLLTRGHAPFEMEDLGQKHGRIVLKRFQKREFPELGEQPLDRLIHKCWWGEYATVKDLAEEAGALPGARESPKATSYDQGIVKLDAPNANASWTGVS